MTRICITWAAVLLVVAACSEDPSSSSNPAAGGAGERSVSSPAGSAATANPAGMTGAAAGSVGAQPPSTAAAGSGATPPGTNPGQPPAQPSGPRPTMPPASGTAGAAAAMPPMAATTPAGVVFPGPNWETKAPADAGFDAAKLETAATNLLTSLPGRQCFAVFRNGYLVYEKYYKGDAHTLNTGYSTSKSFGSTLVGMAVTQGLFKTDDLVKTLLPDSTVLPDVQIKHLLSMSGHEQPLGNDPSRPSALLGDGLNIFSQFELGDTKRVAWSTCVDTASDCLAFKGFSMTPARLADGTVVHLYDLHMEAGSSVADDTARDKGIDQLLAFLTANSQGQAVIIGGDFNLETDAEPAKSQLMRLLQSGGLRDACTELACPSPGNIDKILYRSSDRVTFEAKSWRLEADVFVTAGGMPLSDHPPLAVRIAYQTKPE